MDMDEHAIGIDIRDLEMRAFLEAQTKRVNSYQTCSVMQECYIFQDSADFITAEDNREFLFFFRADEFKGGPLPFESIGKKELDTAKSNRGSGSRPFTDIFVEQEILAQFFFSDFGWRF